MGTYVIIEKDGTTSIIEANDIKAAINRYCNEISTDIIQEGFSIYQVTYELRNQ